MSEFVNLIVTGNRKLDRQLARLGQEQLDAIVSNATSQGLNLLTKAIVRRAPVGKHGSRDKVIGERLNRDSRSGQVEGKSGIGVGRAHRHASAVKYGEPHWHLVAFGTGQRFTKDGANRGVMPSNDFVAAAASGVSSTVGQTVIDGVRKGISKVTS